VGMVGQRDILHHAGLDDYLTLGDRLSGLLDHWFGARNGKPETVDEIMHSRVKTVRMDEPIVELVPVMSNQGLHHIPVVDDDGVFVGVVSQSDLLAGLYESRLAEAA